MPATHKYNCITIESALSCVKGLHRIADVVNKELGEMGEMGEIGTQMELLRINNQGATIDFLGYYFIALSTVLCMSRI